MRAREYRSFMRPVPREASSSFLSCPFSSHPLSALAVLSSPHDHSTPESARWCEPTRGKGTNLSRAWTLTRGPQLGPDSGQRATAHWAQMDCIPQRPQPSTAHPTWPTPLAGFDIGWVPGLSSFNGPGPTGQAPPVSLFGAYHHSHSHLTVTINAIPVVTASSNWATCRWTTRLQGTNT